MDNSNFWKKCSACKKPVNFRQKYWICNVSTCNNKGNEFAFCSVECWDTHNPVMKHRDAWAVEKLSPSQKELEGLNMNDSDGRQGKRIIIRNEEMQNKTHHQQEINKDILVVASKLKQYIRVISGMNTSNDVMPILSDFLRNFCDRAIDKARSHGRKTVLDRDFLDSDS